MNLSAPIRNLSEEGGTYSDPLGLCKCTDECPGGEWAYQGWGGSAVLIGGVSFSRGTFICLSRPEAEVPVKMLCGLIGPLAAAGVGVEASASFLAPAVCGCNGKDLIGKAAQTGISGTVGPAVANVSGCGQGPFSIGKRTLSFGGFKSIGAGLAYYSCDVTRRWGWWDWDFIPED